MFEYIVVCTGPFNPATLEEKDTTLVYMHCKTLGEAVACASKMHSLGHTFQIYEAKKIDAYVPDYVV